MDVRNGYVPSDTTACTDQSYIVLCLWTCGFKNLKNLFEIHDLSVGKRLTSIILWINETSLSEGLPSRSPEVIIKIHYINNYLYDSKHTTEP